MFDEKTQNSMKVLRRIVKKYCSSRFVHTQQFLELIRNHNFQSLDELDGALRAYCHLVLTRDVRNAVFINLLDNTSIVTMNLEISISRGMEQKITVREFIDHGGLAIPKWYLDARNKLSVPK